MKNYQPEADHTSEKSNKVSFSLYKLKHAIRKIPQGDTSLPDFSFPWGLFGGRVLKRNSR